MVHVIDQRLAVAREIEAAHTIDQALALVGFEVVGLDDAPGIVRAGRIMDHALDRMREEERLPFDAGYLSITGLANRKRQHALADPFQINGNRLRLIVAFLFAILLLFSFSRCLLFLLFVLWLSRFLLLVFLVFLLLVLFLALRRLRHGDKGGELVALQQNHVGLHSAWKAEVEVNTVIDRIEHPRPQEVEELASGVERGRNIVQNRLRYLVRLAALHMAQLDGGLLLRKRKAIRQPASIRRPRDTVDTARRTAIKHACGLGLQINHDQFIAMIGDRNHIIGRRHAYGDGAPKLDLAQQFRLTGILGIEDHQRLSARCIVDRHHTQAVVEPLQETIAHPVHFAVLQDRTLPVAHRERLPPRRQRNGVAVGMERVGIKIAASVDKLAIALRAQTGQRYLKVTHVGTRRIKQVEIGASMIDQPFSITRKMARVEILMIGMLAHVLAGGSARIEIANPIVIREKVDTLTNPARTRDIPIQPQKAFKRPAPAGITPEMPGSAPTIALPARKLVGVATNDNASLWPE